MASNELFGKTHPKKTIIFFGSTWLGQNPKFFQKVHLGASLRRAALQKKLFIKAERGTGGGGDEIQKTFF